MKLDKADIAILEALQHDGRLSNRELAKLVLFRPHQAGADYAPWKRQV